MFSCKILDSLGQLSTRGLTQTAVSRKHWALLILHRRVVFIK